jgi:hypothetical protein
MTLIEIPGLAEGLARLGAEEARVGALLDAAMDWVKPWPSRRPGDREGARRDLAAMARNYRWDLDQRNAGKVAGVARELEVIRKRSQDLNEALSALSSGAKLILGMHHAKGDLDAWTRAGGAFLPPEDAGEQWFSPDGSGGAEWEVAPSGQWVEWTEGLAEWAAMKAERLRAKARALGRKTLDDVIRQGPSADLLLKACAAWMEAHEWDARMLTRLARLVHEAATGEKAKPGQFRQAAKRTPKETRKGQGLK